MSSKQLETRIVNEFIDCFQEKPDLLISAPGRINLLGEHVDYHEGKVLPAAIDKNIVLALKRSKEPTSQVFSADLKEKKIIDHQNLVPGGAGWIEYTKGVIHELQNKKIQVGSFKAAFGGDIPKGSGLSSSAALESCFALGLNALNNEVLDRLELAYCGQQAEHKFLNVKCGIMDQFGSIFGKQSHIIELDCRSMEHQYHKMGLGEYSLVLMNTNVHHELASSEYNLRIEECSEGLNQIIKSNSGVNSLRDVSKSDLQKVRDKISPKSYQRCEYVIEEMERVEEMIKAVKSNKIDEIGQLMFRTHTGLSNKYEVSCKELDFLVSHATVERNIIGARMMGGGFGGCTLNLVKTSTMESVVRDFKEKYSQEFDLDLEHYEVTLSDGASILYHNA